MDILHGYQLRFHANGLFVLKVDIDASDIFAERSGLRDEGLADTDGPVSGVVVPADNQPNLGKSAGQALLFVILEVHNRNDEIGFLTDFG